MSAMLIPHHKINYSKRHHTGAYLPSRASVFGGKLPRLGEAWLAGCNRRPTHMPIQKRLMVPYLILLVDVTPVCIGIAMNSVRWSARDDGRDPVRHSGSSGKVTSGIGSLARRRVHVERQGSRQRRLANVDFIPTALASDRFGVIAARD